MKIESCIEYFKKPLFLESGNILENYKIAYETYGILNKNHNNIILVCHALTGSQHSAGFIDGDKKSGWWDRLIGDNKTINTLKYFVISTNVIGSCFGSTGAMDNDSNQENSRLNFPVITIKDMVQAQKKLLDRLKIDKLKLIIGGSMGGMQGLQFAVDYPKLSENIISLASTYETTPWVISFNKVAMESIRRDPRFLNGNYKKDDFKSIGLDGLAIGRIAGHISYLSPASMEKKFSSHYVKDDGLFQLFGRYEVERYMEYNTNNFSKSFDPLSYLYLIKAINTFNLARGYNSLEDVISNVKSNITLISFKSDFLFFPSEMNFLYKKLKNSNKNVSYFNIDSNHGHDAFLVEIDKFKNIIYNVLS